MTFSKAFHCIKELGRGATSKVWLAERKKDFKKVTVKCIFLHFLTMSSRGVSVENVRPCSVGPIQI